VSSPRIRRELRPGDYGAIIELHGRLYAAEYGVDSSFEAHVAASVTRAAMRGFPREREQLWVVESDGAFAGSIALTDEDGETGMIRWVLLDPSLRGGGVGTRMVSEVVEFARQAGYARLELETFSELETAARIYRSHGFRVTSEETGPRWGSDQITYQHYELDLGAGDRSAARPRAAGSTA
jgi:RimJ/RimL family protein N-acetyltransferase